VPYENRFKSNQLLGIIRIISVKITGVMQLLSKCSPLLFSGGTYAPCAIRVSRIEAIVITFSASFLEAKNQLERC
jgi:hypothetical protein